MNPPDPKDRQLREAYERMETLRHSGTLEEFQQAEREAQRLAAQQIERAETGFVFESTHYPSPKVEWYWFWLRPVGWLLKLIGRFNARAK